MADGIPTKYSATLPEGYLLYGKYRICNVLGRGGFGITYKALDANNNTVAVKELFPNDIVTRSGTRVVPKPNMEMSFAEIKDSFAKEVDMLIGLKDIKDIVRIYHAFGDNETYYYVMEYLEGVTLSKRLRDNGVMKWKELSGIVSPVINTLKQLHSVNIIHRDVSPDNIFLLKNGGVKLIDFGNARAYDRHSPLSVYVKKGFAPFEQFQSRSHQGPFTDVYSLCASIYYALSGKLTPNAVERKQEDKIKPIGELCPELPKNLSDAIMRGLSVEPSKRFQTVAELETALYGEKKNIDKNDKGIHIPWPPWTKKGATKGATIFCRRGIYAGRRWPLPPNEVVCIGRDPARCKIAYPTDARGVSGVHLQLYLKEDGRICALDERSRFGTRIVRGGERLTLKKNQWYDISGCMLCFGENEVYEVVLGKK